MKCESLATRYAEAIVPLSTNATSCHVQPDCHFALAKTSGRILLFYTRKAEIKNRAPRKTNDWKTRHCRGFNNRINATSIGQQICNSIQRRVTRKLETDIRPRLVNAQGLSGRALSGSRESFSHMSA
jgi:hypothetical protein